MIPLDQLSWQSFRLVYRTERDALLPQQAGSALHGVLGHLLLARDPALYARLFECRTPPEHPWARKYAAMPNPYVLEPPETGQTRYRSGDPFAFTLTLIGQAADHAPRLLALMEDLGGLSLGKPPEATRMRLERAEPLPAPELPAAEGLLSRLNLLFITPARIFEQGRMPGRPDLPLIVARLAERAALMAHFHCGARLETDYTDLAGLARQARPSESGVWRAQVSRYSSRSRQAMQLEGFLGALEWQQVPAALLPLLVAGVWLHIGKAATLGMGRYELLWQA